MNEMKEEGLLTFEKEKGMVMINSTDKLEKKVDSMFAEEGPSIAATSSCGGVTKVERVNHWWGWSNQVWLNSCDASRMATALGGASAPEGIIGAILGGGVPAIVITVFSVYAGYLAWQIPLHNNGTGVVISFDSTWVVPNPVPNVYSQ